MIKLLFATILENAINSVLNLDSQKHSALETHSGKTLKLLFTDINLELFLVFRPEKIYVYSVYSEVPETTIQGSLINFIKQLKTEGLATELTLVGDTEFAHDVMRLLKNIDINWEEYLATFVGDLPTHHISNFLQHCKQSIKQITNRTIEDTVEFLQEEQHFLPSREQIEDFYEDIMNVRNDIDRLEARLNRLMEQSKNETL